MGRWEPDAQGRLQAAAMQLFAEDGFDRTTVAQIAERAGLTERTFFRYFADKREVLFSGSDELRELLVSGLAAAPASSGPLEAVGAAVEATGEMFDTRRDFARARAAVIAQHPALQERELIKLASLSRALAEGLHARGVTEPAASLTADAGIAVFHSAFARWVAEGEERSFASLARDALGELRAVTAGR